MLLGPDLAALKTGVAERKVGQKTGSWFYFLVRDFYFFSPTSLIIFPIMLLGPDPAARKTGVVDLKVGQKTGQVVWLVYHILVFFS